MKKDIAFSVGGDVRHRCDSILDGPPSDQTDALAADVANAYSCRNARYRGIDFWRDDVWHGFRRNSSGVPADYAVVHYQEALARPNFTIPSAPDHCARHFLGGGPIIAFLVLNFGGSARARHSGRWSALVWRFGLRHHFRVSSAAVSEPDAVATQSGLLQKLK